MNKLLLIVGCFILIDYSCKRENVEFEEFCIAEIDGKKFKAIWLYAYGEISSEEKSINLIASNSDLRERDNRNLPLDFKVLTFSFSDDCASPGYYEIDQ